MTASNTLKISQKFVIKIGSSLITKTSGDVNKVILKNVVKDIVWLINKKKDVVVVSSGAISLGKGQLNLGDNLTLSESQAAAARGQIELMSAWKNEFKKYNIEVAQLLLSPLDIQNKNSSKNAIATIKNLIKFNCVPVINENDSTSNEEIKFGDNDILAAKISRMIQADNLILLSNVDGLLKDPLKINQSSNLIKEVDKITNSIKNLAGDASKYGKGGMISKIKAAQICIKSKCSVIITSGIKNEPIRSLIKNDTKSTIFLAT